MKSKLSTILLVLMLLVGLSLLLYPSFADYWNSMHQSRAVAEYVDNVDNLNEEEYAALIEEARQYNLYLNQKPNRYAISAEDYERYNSVLNLGGNGIMGYIEIPSIGCSLPIYHGTEERVLQVAIGHLEWSSLPIGGDTTHSVVSGHRGLPSAKLFTDLDKLVVGDIFTIRVLNEITTYQIDQIVIVLPEQLTELEVVPGEDYCTLTTCTPYGINTHRILVRGRRIENIEEAKAVFVTSDAVQIDPLVMAPLVASPMLLVLLIYLLVAYPKKKRN